jgi:hypothetical protein
MLRKTALILFLALAIKSNSLQGQVLFQGGARNTIYAEFGGTAGLWSINYDRVIMYVGKFKLGARLGFGLMTEGDKGSTVDTYVPFTINGIYSFKNHHLETGIGFNVASYDIRDVSDVFNVGWKRKTELWGSWHLGYRFQQGNGGMFYRVVYSPFFYGGNPLGRYEHWAGVGIGYTLRPKGFKKKKDKE